jgi:hypothetical protein
MVGLTRVSFTLEPRTSCSGAADDTAVVLFSKKLALTVDAIVGGDSRSRIEVLEPPPLESAVVLTVARPGRGLADIAPRGRGIKVAVGEVNPGEIGELEDE